MAPTAKSPQTIIGHLRSSWYSEMMKSPRVLVLDDEPLVLKATERALAPDFEVISCTTTVQAWERVQEGASPDVYLVDFRLSEPMSGLAFLEEVRERAPAALRGLMTALISPSAAQTLLDEQDIHFFVRKPWDAKGLLQVVKDAWAAKNA